MTMFGDIQDESLKMFDQEVDSENIRFLHV